MMKDFLYYPKLQFSSFKYGEASAYFYPEEYSANTTELATLTDNCSFSRTTHVTVTLTNGEKTDFHGENCVEDAKEFLKGKFDELYPMGLHWIENCLYLGNVQILKFLEKKDKAGTFKISLHYLHRSKFFTDKTKSTQADALLAGELVFQDTDKMKPFILSLIDLERFEKERAEKAVAKLEQKKSEDEFMGLPELTGTEKQIKWAIDLRKKFINSIGINQIVDKKWKKTTFKAKFWIDNRDVSPSELLKLLFLK